MKEEAFSLEDSITELRSIIQKMQEGVDHFDEQIKMFERGTEIIKSSRDFLDASELKVQQLVNGELEDVEIDPGDA